MFLKFVIAIAILGIAEAAVKPVKAVLAQNENNPDPNYTYGYDVQDNVTGDSKTQVENRNGNVVTGEYSLNDPDGNRRTVQYRVDPFSGFVAVVKREPLTNAVNEVPEQSAPVVQPAAEVEPAFSVFRQPVSLIQERIYVAQQPAAQQALFFSQQPVAQQAAFVSQQPGRLVQQSGRLAQQPSRSAVPQHQNEAQEELPTTTVDSEDVEPTTETPVASNGGYYYPKPPAAAAASAALYARKEPLVAKKAPASKAQPKAEKLELDSEEPEAETISPVVPGKALQPVVTLGPVAQVSGPLLSSPYVQAPLFGFSGPYTYSTVTVF